MPGQLREFPLEQELKHAALALVGRGFQLSAKLRDIVRRNLKSKAPCVHRRVANLVSFFALCSHGWQLLLR